MLQVADAHHAPQHGVLAGGRDVKLASLRGCRMQQEMSLVHTILYAVIHCAMVMHKSSKNVAASQEEEMWDSPACKERGEESSWPFRMPDLRQGVQQLCT